VECRSKSQPSAVVVYGWSPSKLVPWMPEGLPHGPAMPTLGSDGDTAAAKRMAASPLELRLILS
jgi:hypothetical protein